MEKERPPCKLSFDLHMFIMVHIHEHTHTLKYLKDDKILIRDAMKIR